VSPKEFLSNKLPPYVFAVVNELKATSRARGEDIVDLGMGNPDMETPRLIVNKLVEAAKDKRNHRYSASRGIPKLRGAVCNRYMRKWGVDIDPNKEAVVTIGSKEGLAHLMLTVLGRGETAVVPEPAYPIHLHSVIIAGGNLVSLPNSGPEDLLTKLEPAVKANNPKVVVVSYPNNPTAACVEIGFFEQVVDLAKKYDFLVIHDLAYGDLTFDGFVAPSILQVKGAKEVAVEIFTMSKSYNMAGWRVGFVVGNPQMVGALTWVKSYMDYGIFQPIQIASIIALNECDSCVEETVQRYKTRRDVLVDSLNRIGWPVEKPRGSMFVWAQIPEKFRALGSLEFAKLLIARGEVAVSPGIGFGQAGDQFVRFALVENEQRIRQAVRGIKRVLCE
jgi:alanine-synthesizing transaminase